MSADRLRAALAAVLFAVPAGAAAPAPAPVQNPGVYVHLTSRGWFTLDPAGAFDAVSAIATGNVYESLVTFKDIIHPELIAPFLSSEVPTKENGLLSADGLVYRFPIRKGVVFHEGQALTPEDVRYSLLRFMLQDTAGGPSGLLLKPLLGVYSTRGADGRVAVDFKEAAAAVSVDKDAVVVRLKRPCAHFLRVLASLPIIVSKPWTVVHGEWDGTEATWKRYNDRPLSESYLNEHMNGTGPFALDKAEPGRTLALKRHERYWRKPAALSAVYLRVVHNPATRLGMLENGDADSSYLEDQDYAEAKELSGVRIEDCAYHTGLGESLFFTFAVDPASEYLGSGKLDGEGVPPDFFADPDVRAGFAYAFDYDAFLRRGMGQRGLRAASPFPASFLSDQPAPARGFDLEKARAAFKKALGGKLWETGFKATLVFSPSAGSRHALVDILREGLARANPKFVLRSRTVHPREFYDAVEAHKLPVFVSGYEADYPSSLSMAFGLLHSQGYYAKAQRFADPALDALIEKADASGDEMQRHELFIEMARRADADLPQVYTFNPTRYKAVRAWVHEEDTHQNVNNLNLDNYPYFYTLSKG